MKNLKNLIETTAAKIESDYPIADKAPQFMRKNQELRARDKNILALTVAKALDGTYFDTLITEDITNDANWKRQYSNIENAIQADINLINQFQADAKHVRLAIENGQELITGITENIEDEVLKNQLLKVVELMRNGSNPDLSNS